MLKRINYIQIKEYVAEQGGANKILFNGRKVTDELEERYILELQELVKSLFSDLDTLKVITTTSENYTDCFGFAFKEKNIYNNYIIAVYNRIIIE